MEHQVTSITHCPAKTTLWVLRAILFPFLVRPSFLPHHPGLLHHPNAWCPTVFTGWQLCSGCYLGSVYSNGQNRQKPQPRPSPRGRHSLHQKGVWWRIGDGGTDTGNCPIGAEVRTLSPCSTHSHCLPAVHPEATLLSSELKLLGLCWEGLSGCKISQALAHPSLPLPHGPNAPEGSEFWPQGGGPCPPPKWTDGNVLQVRLSHDLLHCHVALYSGWAGTQIDWHLEHIRWNLAAALSPWCGRRNGSKRKGAC